jgi:hypothetical protein
MMTRREAMRRTTFDGQRRAMEAGINREILFPSGAKWVIA